MIKWVIEDHNKLIDEIDKLRELNRELVEALKYASEWVDCSLWCEQTKKLIAKAEANNE